MAFDNEFSLLFLYAIFFTARANFDPYSDNKRFMLSFPGSLPNDKSDTLYSVSDFLQDDESVILMTANNEKYKCIIPDTSDGSNPNKQDATGYFGPSEEELLNPLIQQSSCSYKIEPYWTYELCHKNYLRQYHEEREAGKDTKLQEYYLGYYKAEDQGSEPLADKTDKSKDSVRFKQIGGMDLPYYEMMFTDGTVCDLSNTPRKTAVLYICHELGRGEIYELKEVSTCEYEVVILTQLLCSHPDYTPKKEDVNKIHCHAVEKSPRRPNSLINFELENTQARYKPQDQVYPKAQIQKPPEAHTPAKRHPPSTSPHRKPSQNEIKSAPGLSASDKQLLRDFLKGDYCIQGGTGWWKHEFCYGKEVTQFHEDANGKTVVTLGVWNKDEHIKWIERHPTKLPQHSAVDNHVVYHYYGGGDICDITGRPRSVEVKLRCRDILNESSSVSIYLIEKRTCEYNLVIESAILCSVLDKADQQGIIDGTLP